MIKEKHEAGPQTKTLSIMNYFDLTDPVTQILLFEAVLFVLFIYVFVWANKHVKRLDNQLETYASATSKDLTKQQQDISTLRASSVAQDKWLKDTDNTLKLIKTELFKPLYDIGNVVDFTHKDYAIPLTGKVIKVNTFAGDYPDYTVEVEKGITYNIHQSQITAWMN